MTKVCGLFLLAASIVIFIVRSDNYNSSNFTRTEFLPPDWMVDRWLSAITVATCYSYEFACGLLIEAVVAAEIASTLNRRDLDMA